MRIVLLIGRFPPEHLGGAELQAASLARRLAARGHEITVLTAKRGHRENRETRDFELYMNRYCEKQTPDGKNYCTTDGYRYVLKL